jgi:flagellar FliJ protein
MTREEMEKRKLAETKREELKGREELQQLGERNREAIESIGRRMSGAMNPGEMTLQYKYVQMLRANIKRQEGKVQEAEANTGKQREVLLGASRDKKVLEKLREKKWDAYMRELSREEQGFLDEVASSVPRRKSENHE